MRNRAKGIVGLLFVPVLVFAAFGIIYYTFSLLDTEFGPIISIMIALAPIWLPVMLFYILWDQWMWSVHESFKVFNGRTTFRIKLPQEVFKSPEAMESVLTQIHNVNTPDNLMQTYLDGKHPLISSFELVSIGGEVRFYANVPTKKVKNSLEAQLYAQYPGVEVIEEPLDYTAEVKWDPEEWDMISFHMGKREDEIYPIKTYIDYGMDKLPKEELKFEPMAPMLEYLGSAKPHERVWIQFLLEPHVKKVFKNGSLKVVPTWEKRAQKVIDEIMGRDKDKQGAKEETESRPLLTMTERETISAIERNVGKYAFHVAIRAIYITKAGKFDPDMISPLIRSFSQYDIMNRNSIGVRWRTDFNYNFLQDITGSRKLALKKEELEYYKLRFYLHKEKKSRIDFPRLMSVEELATMFHLPGTTVVTPNLTRVETTRKEAPANLPIGPIN